MNNYCQNQYSHFTNNKADNGKIVRYVPDDVMRQPKYLNIQAFEKG